MDYTLCDYKLAEYQDINLPKSHQTVLGGGRDPHNNALKPPPPPPCMVQFEILTAARPTEPHKRHDDCMADNSAAAWEGGMLNQNSGRALMKRGMIHLGQGREVLGLQCSVGWAI